MLPWIVLAVLSETPQAPPQPLAEQEVAVQFEQAAPLLLEQWIALRPIALKAAALGTQVGTAGMLGGLHFEFIDCADAGKPALHSIDVRKTDSILSPFIGVILAKTTELCVFRPVWPRATGGKDAQIEMIAACVGKPYEDCIGARGKPMAERYNRTFRYEGDITLSYRWTKGAWEFDREELKQPRQFPQTEQKDPLARRRSSFWPLPRDQDLPNRSRLVPESPIYPPALQIGVVKLKASP